MKKFSTLAMKFVQKSNMNLLLQISPPTVTPSGPGKSVTVARVSLWPHRIFREGKERSE